MSFDSFSLRLFADDRIAKFPALVAGVPNPDQTYVLAMKSQVLVAKSALAPGGFTTAAEGTVKILLGTEEVAIPWKLITSLLEGIPLGPPDDGIEDVYVYELELPPDTDIFAVTNRLREAHKGIDPRKITPNHVPIPANLSNNCPYGPPNETATAFVMPKSSTPPTVRVTVIDSGYIPPEGGIPEWEEYVANFLDFPAAVEPGYTTGDRLPAAGAGLGWQPTNAETISMVTVPAGPGAPYEALPALVGHANFVLGLILERSVSPYIFHGLPKVPLRKSGSITLAGPLSKDVGGGLPEVPLPKLELIAHDGSFIEDASDIVTEATIIHSLCQAAGSADVINLNYAFPAYGPSPITGNPTVGWDAAMELLSQHPIVVCPAGNQADSDPRFPAALRVLFPKQPLFDNVVGVGSSTPATGPDGFAGPYSNYGSKSAPGNPGTPWVTCACDGTDAVSTFLPIKTALEDAHDGTVIDFTATGVAAWTGTCFATAKVTAAICYELATTEPRPTPAQAWAKVESHAGAHDDTDAHYKGTILPFL